MLAKNPVDLGREKKFSKEEIAQAIRWAIIAELDAVNFYVQLAERIEDESVKKVFLDIAKEEKEHIGEFLELLLRIDKEQVKALESGRKEVLELLGKE